MCIRLLRYNSLSEAGFLALRASARRIGETKVTADSGAAPGSGRDMQDLYEARRRFIDTGDIAPTVRPVVRESWERCRQYGINPERVAPQRLDRERLQHARQASASLLDAADDALHALHRTLDQRPHLIALSDSDGIILRVLCDPVASAVAREASSLFEGACWHERDLGCNGVGTALATDDSVILIGPEHFAWDYSGWTCIGIPLHGAEGKLVGALDLSVPNEHTHIHTWGWTLSIARAIDQRIISSAFRRRPGPIDGLDDIYRPFQSVRGVIELLARQLGRPSATHEQFLSEALTQLEEAENRLRQLVAALSDARREKDNVLHVVAHELASPLAAIRNAIVVKRMANDVQKVRLADDIIERQAEQLFRLVQDLMDMARLHHGKLGIQKQRIEVCDVLRQTIRAVSPIIKRHRHTFVQDLGDSPLWVCADPVRIEQIAANLLVNAAKYTPPGGTIELAARRDGAHVVFSVRDNGVGIEKSKLATVFEMFSQLDGSRSEGGVGIGLAVVRTLVEAHGGRVEAASAGANKGSTFTVRLPADSERSASAGAAEDCIRGQGANGQGA